MAVLELEYVFSAIILGIIIKWIFNLVNDLIKCPSGPWGLPIVGYIPWLEKNTAKSFIAIGKKYGNVFSVGLGGETVVVLNDWPAVKDSLIDQPKVFKGRPFNVTWFAATQNKDVGFGNGPVTEAQKNIVIQCMRDSGMGKSDMEGLVKESIHDLFQTLYKYNGKTVETTSLFFMSILKITWKLVANQNFDDQNEEILKFNDDIRLLFQKFGPANLFNLFPWVRHIPPNGFGFKQFLEANERVKAYLRLMINSHKKSLIEGSEVDLIDHYLAKIHINKDKTKDSSKSPYTDERLLASSYDIFLAGVDTTNATLLWSLLFLACHPDVQKEAQKELNLVVGRQRLPSLDDYPRLPYTEAVIMEIHRLANVVPLSVPHFSLAETKVCNVTIPKGATCLQNIYAIHHDPTLWEEPETFNPKRFLNENNEVKWPPFLMPFSVGPRLCPGKSFAEIKLKLFISCLLHQFSFSLPPGHIKVSFEGVPGLTVHPQPYSVLVTVRKE